MSWEKRIGIPKMPFRFPRMPGKIDQPGTKAGEYKIIIIINDQHFFCYDKLTHNNNNNNNNNTHIYINTLGSSYNINI